MSRIFRIPAQAFVAFALVLPAWSGESEDRHEIVSLVEQTWEMLATKKISDGLVGPQGSIQAHSSGGLWFLVTQESMTASLEESPNTLLLSPRHIDVRFLGSSQDVAYVTYYLVGRIARSEGDDVLNYRTRASNVMEKIDGRNDEAPLIS